MSFLKSLVNIVLFAGLVGLANLQNTENGSGKVVKAPSLASFRKYLALPTFEQIFYGDFPISSGDVRFIGIPKYADAETALKSIKAAKGTGKVSDEFLSNLIELSADEAHLDCYSIRKNVIQASDAFGVALAYGDYNKYYKNFYEHYGGRAYEFCVHKLSIQFPSGPVLGEQEFDKIIAASSGPEMDLAHFDQVDHEELFRRATKVDLAEKSSAFNVRRMLKVATELRVSERTPKDLKHAVKRLLNYLLAGCNRFEGAVKHTLKMMSMAYALRGSKALEGLEPRLFKLLEYGRICTARLQKNGVKMIKEHLEEVSFYEKA